MTDNSLEGLLAWMKTGSAMLRWGIVAAFDRRKANLLIMQEYIRRFDTGSYIKPIEGGVPIVENRWMEYISDFLLDTPRLSFVNADINDSRAMLTMAIMGGSQFTLKKESVGWIVDKVNEIDSLQGPKLYLDLLLNQVPGDVEIDGRVKLDLSKSDDFRLTFGQTDHEQRMGGGFFKDLFNQLPDEDRVYPLGSIERGNNELMTPQSFELRTQTNPATRDPRSAEHGDGAILALIRTLRRTGGDFPGKNYRYLIPGENHKDYSATVLFDRQLTAASILFDEVLKYFESEGFWYEFDGDGKLVNATLKPGRMIVPAMNETFEPVEGRTVTFECTELRFPADASQPLIVEFGNDNKLLLKWNSQAQGHWTYTQLAGGEPYTQERLYKTETQIEYALVENAGGELFLVQTDFKYNVKTERVDVPGVGTDIWDELFLELILAMVIAAFLSTAVQEGIKKYFRETIGTKEPVNRYISDMIKLNFGHAIQGNEIYAPSNIGFFGRINPDQTSFVISPMEPLLNHGSTQQFTTDPVMGAVQWKVENLVVKGPGNAGSIDKRGLYRAPPAGSFPGRFIRVRVTATDLETGYFTSALVTVMANELTVNPLIQTCDVGASVELSAGQLGAGPLHWSIKNPVAGESGTVLPSVKPDGDHAYHHGPVVANKTFVLDEIQVKTDTGGARSVHVLALQKQPGVMIKIKSIDPAQGLVQLEAIINGIPMAAHWSLPLGGPGSWDAPGLYRAVPSTTERYVLIFALVDGGPFGDFEGYRILPLPLVEFPALLQVLANE